MPLVKIALTQSGVKYKVLKLDSTHVDELHGLIRERLAVICYGKERINIEPDEYTYKEACRQLSENLIRYKPVMQYGLIGELLMHVLAPHFLDFEAESMSVILSLQNQNIKPGFDLNFYEGANKKIWYGEVKSGLAETSRDELLERARDGLRLFFDNINATGKKATRYRWEAAKSEVATMFARGKKVGLTKLLTSDRDLIGSGDRGRRNAILMAVSFGDDNYGDDVSDIESSIERIDGLNNFDEYFVICIHYEAFANILKFLQSEGA